MGSKKYWLTLARKIKQGHIVHIEAERRTLCTALYIYDLITKEGNKDILSIGAAPLIPTSVDAPLGLVFVP